MTEPSPAIGYAIAAYIVYMVSETMDRMAKRPRDPNMGIPPPTKTNPEGGDSNQPPPTTNDPSQLPVTTIPPGANTTYTTSINQYPRGGFCGINTTARYDWSGELGIRTVAWAPEMNLYGSLSGCLGREDVRAAAAKYWSPQDVPYYDRGVETSGVVWVTPNPYPGATHSSSYTPPTDFDTGEGCYFYDTQNGDVVQGACPWIVPMGTPAERETRRTDITSSTNMWQEFGKAWYGWN